MAELSGNKGEWSEIYIFLKLMTDGKVYAADRNMQKLETVFLNIVKIIREEVLSQKYEYYTGKQIKIFLNGEEVAPLVDVSEFDKCKDLLWEKLSSTARGNGIACEEVEGFLNSIHVTKLKAPAFSSSNFFGGTEDITMEVMDYRSGVNSVIGFSCKSDFSAKSTLFNASADNTNFVYEVVGNVDDDLMKEFKWNDERSNMVIDEDSAKFVRLMFGWKIEGWSIPSILDALDRMGAPNPEARKREVGTRDGDPSSYTGWYSSSLYSILTNPHYVGDTVLGRSMKAIYKNIPSHNVKDKDEWIVFPDTHEAIISREDFQKVQDIMNAASEARQTKMQKSEEIRATLINLFEGKIVCADCGRKMYFHRKRIDKDKRGRWYAPCELAV